MEDTLKSLVEDSPSGFKEAEEKMNGQVWTGSLLPDIPNPPPGRRKRGSSFKQVVAALFGNIGSINTGMMFGFSAVTIPQLRHPDSFIQITEDEASWIAALSSVTTPFGCILSGYLLDAIGRKRTIIVTMLPMIVGWSLISSATSVYMIYAGRLFVGLGAGMMESPARVYTGEVTQPHLRGMLAAGASVGMSFGVSLQYVVGAFLPWNWLSFINGVIPTVGFISAFFLPESPTWLLIKGHTEEAFSALSRLRGPTCDLEGEFQDLMKFSRKMSIALNQSTVSATLHSVLRPYALKPFVILSVFFVIYQFSGISPLTFYAVDIFQESGSSMNPNVATIVLGLVRLAATVVSLIRLRRCGRRPLTFISTIFSSLSMYGLGYYMYQVLQWRVEGAEPVATWFPAFILFFFMASVTMGLAVLPWVMIGELYPSKVRGIMGGMTTFVGHFCVFLAIKTFPLLQSFSRYGTFLLYGTVTLVGTIYLYFYLPETKGKPLQEIEDFFRGRTKTLKPPKEVNHNCKS